MASETKELKGEDAADDESGREDQLQKAPPAKGPPTATSTGQPGKPGHGFFTIYKKGQGYWTRMGTAVAAFLLIALTAVNIYNYLPSLLSNAQDPGLAQHQRDLQGALANKTNTPAQQTQFNSELSAVNEQLRLSNEARARTINYIAISVAVIFAGGFSYMSWRMMNKADNVDFLIATDSEMKKVNWTTKKELIGSTKVVIFFMVMIAVFLFVCDLIFGYFFFLIHVLKSNPFGSGTMGGG